MEARGDLDSVLQFLPLVLRSSSLFWPCQALEALKALSLGSDVSGVRSGKVLFDAILDLRDSLGLSPGSLAPRASTGFALLFDEVFILPSKALSSCVAGIELPVTKIES